MVLFTYFHGLYLTAKRKVSQRPILVLYLGDYGCQMLFGYTSNNVNYLTLEEREPRIKTELSNCHDPE